MVYGNINRLLRHIAKVHDKACVRGATAEQRKSLLETIDRLERFCKTKEGFAWDQKNIQKTPLLELLTLCYAEMAKHDFK